MNVQHRLRERISFNHHAFYLASIWVYSKDFILFSFIISTVYSINLLPIIYPPQECLLANPLVIPLGLSQLSLTYGFLLLLVRILVIFVPPHVHNSLLNTSHPNHTSQPGSYGTQGAVYNVILSAAWSSSTNVVAVGFVSTTSAGLILRSTNGGVSWSLLGV